MGFQIPGTNFRIPGVGGNTPGTGGLMDTVNEQRFKLELKTFMSGLTAQLEHNVGPEKIKLPEDGKPSGLLKLLQNGLNALGHGSLQTDGKPSDAMKDAINSLMRAQGKPEITDMKELSGKHVAAIVGELYEKDIFNWQQLRDINKDIEKNPLVGLGRALYEIDDSKVSSMAGRLATKPGNKPAAPGWNNSEVTPDQPIIVAEAPHLNAGYKGGYVYSEGVDADSFGPDAQREDFGLNPTTPVVIGAYTGGLQPQAAQQVGTYTGDVLGISGGNIGGKPTADGYHSFADLITGLVGDKPEEPQTVALADAQPLADALVQVTAKTSGPKV